MSMDALPISSGLAKAIEKAKRKNHQKPSRFAMLINEMELGEIEGNKYHVAKKEDRFYKGVQYASKKEMIRFQQLELLVKSGVITDLQTQVHFNLMQGFIHHQHGKIKAIEYIADFLYKDLEGVNEGKYVVEDSKGMRTDVYQIKRKLFL